MGRQQERVQGSRPWRGGLLPATGDRQQRLSRSRNRVAAVGPEVSVMFPKQMFFVSLRYNYEFMAESRAQGNAITLTLTKRF
jgi:hypothetical protein